MRASKHDEKRRKRFEAAGVQGEDIRYSVVSYDGRQEDCCSLCDHSILHRYRLAFRRPGQHEVVFFPVGSQCIRDWVQAMPDSPEKTAALQGISNAEEVARRVAKEARAREKLIDHLDQRDEDGAVLMRQYYALPEEVRTAKLADPNQTRREIIAKLQDIGGRVARFRGFASEAQREFFGVLLKRLAEHDAYHARVAHSADGTSEETNDDASVSFPFGANVTYDAPPVRQGSCSATAVGDGADTKPETGNVKLQYRKTRDGAWAVFGPVSALRAGATVTVHKKDGSTKQEKIRAVSTSFDADGVRCCYGYIEERKAEAPASRQGGSRGTRTGCSCGSVEEYSKDSDCWTCKHDAE